MKGRHTFAPTTNLFVLGINSFLQELGNEEEVRTAVVGYKRWVAGRVVLRSKNSEHTQAMRKLFRGDIGNAFAGSSGVAAPLSLRVSGSVPG